MSNIIATFSCTHDAIFAEKTLQPHLALQMMPTPRSISASCGISIRLSAADFSKAAVLLGKQKIAVNFYEIGATGTPVLISPASTQPPTDF